MTSVSVAMSIALRSRLSGGGSLPSRAVLSGRLVTGGAHVPLRMIVAPGIRHEMTGKLTK